MSSLFVLFFAIPLYFSHVFSPLGIIIGDVSSFERQKIYLFVILICIALCEGFFRFPDRIIHTLKKYFFVILALALIPIFSSFLSGGEPFSSSYLFGSYEKHHGYILYVMSIIFTVLLMSTPHTWIKRYIFASLCAAVIMAIISIGESIGGLFDIYGRQDMLSMYSGRSSSTLGNPNYVAGYLLVFIPVIFTQITQYRKNRFIHLILMLLLIGGIYTTGSYIATYLLLALFFYYYVRHIFPHLSLLKQFAIFLISLIILTYIISLCIDPEKLLSLKSRFVLMQEALYVLWGHPLGLFVGFGSEAVLDYFSHTRSVLVNNYFPSNMLIDSTHNVVIDIIFQYGIFPIAILMHFLYTRRHYLISPIGISIILALLFLFLNVIVISHLIIVILLFITLDTLEKKKSK